MKSINYFSRLSLNMVSLACIIVMAMGTTVYALHMTKMPRDLQTRVPEAQMRQISLKLPLQQPAFHWTFMSKEKYLAGKLVLRIKRGDKTTEITIFKDGKITQDWGKQKGSSCYSYNRLLYSVI